MSELKIESSFPWYVKKRKDQNYLTVIRDSLDRSICVMCMEMRNKAEFAHFIEAAPDMLRELKFVCQTCESPICAVCGVGKALRKAGAEPEPNPLKKSNAKVNQSNQTR